LCWLFQFEFVQEQLQFAFRLGVAGQDHFPAINGGNAHIQHLHRGKRFEHGSGRQSWSQVL
jgi:hypothetical protein